MRISFEYDGTLGTYKVESLCRYAIEFGHEVFIVTKRDKIARKNRVVQNLPIFILAKRLGILKKNVIFTSRELKVGYLLGKNIDCHFDNCNVELFFIKKNKEKRIKTFHVLDKRVEVKFKSFLERK